MSASLMRLPLLPSRRQHCPNSTKPRCAALPLLLLLLLPLGALANSGRPQTLQLDKHKQILQLHPVVADTFYCAD